jgi:hypothetical protein
MNVRLEFASMVLRKKAPLLLCRTSGGHDYMRYLYFQIRVPAAGTSIAGHFHEIHQMPIGRAEGAWNFSSARPCSQLPKIHRTRADPASTLPHHTIH